MNPFVWVSVFLGAAVLEIGGDAFIRKGLRGQGSVFIPLGFLVLSCYGLLVNMVRWDFSKLLGVYVAFFTLISVLAGRFYFGETIPFATWLGTGVIIAGGLIIQLGS